MKYNFIASSERSDRRNDEAHVEFYNSIKRVNVNDVIEIDGLLWTVESVKKVWESDDMKDILNRYDDQVCKAVVKIYENQTSDEQSSHETKHVNGIGFNGADANIMSSFAEFYIKRGFLSPKQIMIARKKIMKYAGQLANIANNQ